MLLAHGARLVASLGDGSQGGQVGVTVLTFMTIDPHRVGPARSGRGEAPALFSLPTRAYLLCLAD